MELDATRVARGETIETELCIIGAGPAGLVVAAQMAASGREVVLLESGTVADEAGAQALNDGIVVGDAYRGLQTTRHRAVGGTTVLWNTPAPGGVGAKYVPLDPWDLEPRWPEAPDGWPIPYEALRPLYVRAQALCGLGRFANDGVAWRGDDGAESFRLASEGLIPAVYRMGSRSALLEPLLASARDGANTRLYPGSTVVQFAVDATGATVTVATPDGARWQVRAKRLVLAGGAVENARLLLLCAASGGGVHDRSGWLGRGFMEHPRDRSLVLSLAPGTDPRQLAWYDAHAAADGTTIVGRLALAERLAREPGMLNASGTLLPIVRPMRERLRSALGRVGRLRALQRWLPAGGHGWSRHPSPARVFDGFIVLLNLEQPPRRENAIVLGERRDAYGTPLPVLHWRWHPEDQMRLERLRRLVASALERSGIGRVAVVEGAAPDPHAHHHAGTTRMHPDPRHGVVDADGRVHGTESLFVVGASTFPSAGFANPMLTLVAMALRLADRLAAEG